VRRWERVGASAGGIKDTWNGTPNAITRNVMGKGARSSAGYSTRSLALAAAVVCHCMLPGSSAPPRFNAFTWSIT
jgi:hypothetical protein